ncbi:MAG: hypothetical protein FNNCIFGK_02126 [Bacteroidia bacterium]|nr:hypothetical protein [Bacteroidia bacterium]
MTLKAVSNCSGVNLSKSRCTKPLYISRKGICLFSVNTADGVKANNCFFLLAASSALPCSSNALISSTSALYLPLAISLPIRSNDLFSTGTVKFLNMVLDAIVLFFQLIKKSYFLRLLRIT